MIDRIGLAYGLGMVAGMLIVILFLAFAIAVLGIQACIENKGKVINIPDKLDPVKAMYEDDVSYVQGWNDCIAKILEE